MRASLACCLLAAFAAAPALAQPAPPLVTDRPDFTESGVTVPVGSVQVEGGFTYAEADGVGQTNGSELLVRWSPARRFEVRLAAPDFVLTDDEGGVGDPSVGLKVQLGPVAGWDLGLVAATTLPLGDERLGADGAEPEAILSTGRDLGPVSLGGQLAAGWNTEADRVLLGGTLVVGIGLAERLGGFAEVAVAEEPTGRAAILLHSGLTFEAAPLVQLDLHLGAGITDTAPDVLIGAGLSIRR